VANKIEIRYKRYDFTIFRRISFYSCLPSWIYSGDDMDVVLAKRRCSSRAGKNADSFILGGMLAVLFVLPVQKLVYYYFSNQETLSFFLWASIEEIFKFLFIYFIALRNRKFTDEPVDDIIYMIVGALGFVTFENTLFLTDLVHTEISLIQ